MRYVILCFLTFLSVTAFAQKDTTQKEYLGVLTLTEKYQDAKNWGKTDEAIVGEHFQRLKKFKSEGKVLLAGRTSYETDNPDMMGLVIFYAKDDKEALQCMIYDPA